MREQVASFGSAGSVCGVVSLPVTRAEPGWGVLLLNAGLLHRVGPHRWYVQIARSLAAQGLTALRFDFAGVGDSAERKSGGDFEHAAVHDIQEAMSWLAEHHGCRRFALLGMCSGARIAFRAACEDLRVDGLVLINAPRYHDDDPDPEFVNRVKRRHRARRRWSLALASPRNWRRLVSGRAGVTELVCALGRRFRGLLTPRGAVPAGDVEHAGALLDRDVRILLLMSEGDWTLEYARAIFAKAAGSRRRGAQASGGGPVAGNPRLEVVRGGDHTLTSIASRQAALGVITGWARDLVARDADPALHGDRSAFPACVLER